MIKHKLLIISLLKAGELRNWATSCNCLSKILLTFLAPLTKRKSCFHTFNEKYNAEPHTSHKIIFNVLYLNKTRMELVKRFATEIMILLEI